MSVVHMGTYEELKDLAFRGRKFYSRFEELENKLDTLTQEVNEKDVETPGAVRVVTKHEDHTFSSEPKRVNVGDVVSKILDHLDLAIVARQWPDDDFDLVPTGSKKPTHETESRIPENEISVNYGPYEPCKGAMYEDPYEPGVYIQELLPEEVGGNTIRIREKLKE